MSLFPLGRNSQPVENVYKIVNSAARRAIPVLSVLSVGAALSVRASYSDYLSAKQKFDQIQNDHLRAGSRIVLSSNELNAYVEREVPMVTGGVRNPHLELVGPQVVRGTALIDFARLERSQGQSPGWLMSKLLEGERPVSVTARIRSADGRATVDVQSVAISGVEIDGRMLDFLIQNFLLPLYPTAAVGRPFELAYHIERLDVQPSGVGVVIGR